MLVMLIIVGGGTIVGAGLWSGSRLRPVIIAMNSSEVSISDHRVSCVIEDRARIELSWIKIRGRTVKVDRSITI